jgi:hypothetical protein
MIMEAQQSEMIPPMRRQLSGFISLRNEASLPILLLFGIENFQERTKVERWRVIKEAVGHIREEVTTRKANSLREKYGANHDRL